MRLSATRASVCDRGFVNDTAATAPWTPADLDTNLKLWLDASDLSTLTVSSSKVTQWDDKSGTGNHVTQPIATHQFTTGTRTLNSLNVLDGSNSQMQILYDFGNQNTTPVCILGVAGWDTQGTNHSIIDGDVGANRRILIRRRANNVLALWTGTWLNDTNTVGIDNILFTAIANAANSEISVNGQPPNTGNTGTNEGLRNKIVVQHTDGIWAELLVYTGAMSTSDQEKAEGYFAHKWGLTAGLPSNHPYKSAPPTKASSVTAWTPSNLATDLQLWFDASDASTITLNGSTVSQWDDKSGNNRHATQATASNQPTYTTAGLNGKNVLTFSNAGGTNLAVPSTTSDYFPYQSAFIVYSDSSQASYVTPLGGLYGGSTTGAPYHGHVDNTQLFSAQYTSSITRNGDNFKNGTDIGDGTSTSRLTTPAIFSYIPTGQFDVYRRFGFIGADFAKPTLRGITGLIAEVIILENAASTANRQKIEGYLAHKWGLTADLPSNHPYKNSAPTV